jgi:ketosteroid isomerase-like protein
LTPRFRSPLIPAFFFKGQTHMQFLLAISVVILTGLNVQAQNQRRTTDGDPIANSTPGVVSQRRAAKSAIVKKLSKVSADWASYWRQKQLDRVVALYAPDAAFLTGTGARINGRSAIRAAFKTALETNSSDLTPRSLGTEVSGDLAYDSGDYRKRSPRDQAAAN